MSCSGRCSSGRVERPPGCQAEVENLDEAVRRDEQVLGFQVAVNDAPGVRGGESARHLLRVVGGLACRKRSRDELSAKRLSF
jgi:hypothetical protein